MTTKKLILHSDQTLEKTADLDKKLFVSLSGKRTPSIGYLPSIPDPKRRYFQEKQNYYQRIGFPDCAYFDVEDPHSDEEIKSFFTRDILHLSGGSPDIFLSRLEESGYKQHLLDFINRGKVVVGISAGAMLLGPTIGIIPFLKKNNSINTYALNIVDFEVYPHWNENSASAKDLARYVQKTKNKMYCLSDGECIVVNGTKIKFIGEIIEILADGSIINKSK